MWEQCHKFLSLNKNIKEGGYRFLKMPLAAPTDPAESRSAVAFSWPGLHRLSPLHRTSRRSWWPRPSLSPWLSGGTGFWAHAPSTLWPSRRLPNRATETTPCRSGVRSLSSALPVRGGACGEGGSCRLNICQRVGGKRQDVAFKS